MFSCEFYEISHNAYFKKPFERLLLHKHSFSLLSHQGFSPFQKWCHTYFPVECFLGFICRLGTRVNKKSLTWLYVLKTSWRHLCKTSWRCLEDIFASRFEDVLARPLKYVLMTSWRRLEDVLKLSWRFFARRLKTYDQDEYLGLDQDVLKMSSEDVWLRRINPSWSRSRILTFNVFREKFNESSLMWTPFIAVT